MLLTAADLAGLGLIAGATLAGAWLGRRGSRLPAISPACAALCLLIVVGADLLPDVWRDLRQTGLPWWVAAMAAAAGLGIADRLVRRGCACAAAADVEPGAEFAGGSSGRHDGGPTSGRAAAAALAAHRAVEGAAVALAGSAAVIAALATHAASEGFALAALLRGERRGRVVALVVMTCVSPAAGAVVLSQVAVPAAATPVLTSVVAGVLVRTALAAWQLRPRPGRHDEPAAAKCAIGCQCQAD